MDVSLGARLRAAREAKKLTIDEVARTLGRPLSWLSNLETGRTKNLPEPHQFRELAAIDRQLAEFVDVPDPADLTAYISALDGIAETFALARDADKRALLAMLGDVVYAGGVVSLRYHPEIALLIPHPAAIEVRYERGYSGDGMNQWRYRRLP